MHMLGKGTSNTHSHIQQYILHSVDNKSCTLNLIVAKFSTTIIQYPDTFSSVIFNSFGQRQATKNCILLQRQAILALQQAFNLNGDFSRLWRFPRTSTKVNYGAERVNFLLALTNLFCHLYNDLAGPGVKLGLRVGALLLNRIYNICVRHRLPLV